MKFLRAKSFSTFLCLLLAVLIFNISIDPPDSLKNMDDDIELEEDLSQNEIESVAELILENGLDIENAIPESDDPDSDGFFKKYEVFQGRGLKFEFMNIDISVAKLCYPTFTTFFVSTSDFRIITPPPEV